MLTGLFKTPRVGLEPTTTRLTAECSTIELSRIIKGIYLQNHIQLKKILTSPLPLPSIRLPNLLDKPSTD